MLNGKRIAVVFPAYNAGQTLSSTLADIPTGLVDEFILVDDHSQDNTAALADALKIETHVHQKNLGYGGNQKTCYRLALSKPVDIIVMLHPDYQYTPKLLRAMCSLIADGVYEMVLGSRILTGGAVRGGMPLYKYISNRFITFIENLLLGAKLSEYHTGYRAYHRSVLERIAFDKFSDDFIFDNQFLIAAITQEVSLGEISCPTKYFAEASSINFSRSLRYGLLCLWYALLAGARYWPRRLSRARRKTA
jgi:glycosyltransferase involved in cell wall biosynthesis